MIPREDWDWLRLQRGQSVYGNANWTQFEQFATLNTPTLEPKKEPEMTKEPCFYVVWRIGGEAPTRTHDNPDEAQAEARRLALKCRGEKFAVLKAVSSHAVQEVIDTEYADDHVTEPPF